MDVTICWMTLPMDRISDREMRERRGACFERRREREETEIDHRFL